jgi:diguanylate cyclase
MWNRKKDYRDDATRESQSAAETPPPGAELTDDAALDAVAALLRTFGKYSFDLAGVDAATFERHCEAWALHILLRSARPGLETQYAPLPEGRRDWAGLQAFVAERRRSEQQHVTRSLDDLRQVVWAFVQSLRSAFAEEAETDDLITDHIDRLRIVADGRSLDEIKKGVLDTVDSLTRLVAERKQRQTQQLAELGSKVSELGSQLQQARLESTVDGLTRLYNRRAFDDYLNKLVYLRDVFGQTSCLLMIDVDHFKWINDTYGHQAGDMVLRTLADCLARSFPRKTDFVARFGGEEFAALLPDTGLVDARRLAERLLQTIRETPSYHGEHVLRVSVSAGLAEIAPGEAGATWLRRADEALYAAKQAGRDRLREAPQTIEA